jgi:thymidylate synthase
MYDNEQYNNEQGYLNLLQEVLTEGHEKKVYGNNEVIRSVFGRMLRFDISNNQIPIYTTKKVFYKGAFLEMLWFLSGKSDIKVLLDNNVNIWNKYGYAYYLELFKKSKVNETLRLNCNVNFDSEDNKLELETYIQEVKNGNLSGYIPIHYTNMTNLESNNCIINQINWAVDTIKTTPERKHIIVNYWRPENVYQMAAMSNNESVQLPACHMSHQIDISDDKLSLLVYIRSNDLFLGNPFNVAQYGLLAHMYSELTGYQAHELIVFIANAHIYSNQFEQCHEQIKRLPYTFPKINFEPKIYSNINEFVYDDILITDYHHHDKLEAELIVAGGYNK